VSQSASPPLRLTRRGRLAVTVVVVVALVAAMALLSSLGSQARPDHLDAVPAGAEPAGGTVSGTDESGQAGAEEVAVRAPRPRPVPERVVSQRGSGELSVVPGRTRASDTSGRIVRYRVLVEDGLTLRGEPVDEREFARVVHRILTDERGWQPIDDVAFARVSAEGSDVDVVLASPDTTDALCAPLGTGGWLSCFNGYATVLNARRWFAGAASYGDDLVGYRRYLVSHEMGHYLGYQHVACPAPGAVAPVMVQQTKSLDGCEKGPWPAEAT